MEQTTQNNSRNVQNEVIDLRELFDILKRRKKLIWSITTLITLLALVYALIATPWYQVNATLEIGKYIDNKTGEAMYLENGAGVSERLNIQYVDIYKHVNGRDTKITSIKSSKKNSQFIAITAIGKDNKQVVSEVQKMIDILQNKHQKIIDEIIAKKQSKLDGIDRAVFQIKFLKIPGIDEKINYIKTVELPFVDKKIISIESNLKNSMEQKDEAIKNLTSLNDQVSLAALRMAHIQTQEYRISENEIKLINLNTKKQQLLSTTLPTLARDMKRLQKIDLVALQERYKLTALSMQSHNYHNTKVIGNIISQDTPVKPKKKLIVVVAFITGLMLSIFLAFFLAFIGGMKKEEISE